MRPHKLMLELDFDDDKMKVLDGHDDWYEFNLNDDKLLGAETLIEGKTMCYEVRLYIEELIRRQKEKPDVS